MDKRESGRSGLEVSADYRGISIGLRLAMAAE
jgi:hypothetical protein